MFKKIFFLILSVSISAASAKNLEQPFDKGEINLFKKYFSGTSYINHLVTKDDVYNSAIGNFTFEPQARTNWHKYSGGQILLITAGEGRYQQRGEEIQTLKQGDVVLIPPNVEHWYGASIKSSLDFISVEPNIPNNRITWLEPVSDEEYK